MCDPGFVISNGGCVVGDCGAGCQTCSNNVCTQCVAAYYQLVNGACNMCDNAPQCVECNTSGCTQCNAGYYLVNNTCQACQSFCRVCTNSTFCIVPFMPFGVTLMETAVGVNQAALCDAACFSCSASNPTRCNFCLPGFYLNGYICSPCTYSSRCESCQQSNPSSCLTCFPGSFMANNNTCISCAFPCATCSNNNANTCSSCAQGYVLINSNSTCMLASKLSNNVNAQPILNCANQQLTGTTVTCSLCQQGFALTTAGCAPCVTGCQVCNPEFLNQCVECEPGYMLNASNLCMKSSNCPAGCTACTSFGCLDCV